MPQAIPAVLFLLNASPLVVAAATIATAVYTSSQARRQQRRAADAQRAAYNAGLQDRTTTFRSSVAPRNMVLGRDRVSGPLWPWFTWGDKRQYHTFGVTLAGHECDAVETVYFNEDPVTLDASGYVTAPAQWTKRVQITTVPEIILFGGATAGATYTLPIVPDAVVSCTTDVETQGELGGTRSDTIIVPYTLAGAVVTFPEGSVGGAFIRISYTYTQVIPLFKVTAYLGAPGQAAAPELMAAAASAGVPASWDATRTGTGVTYLTVQMTADYEVLGQIGVPNISAVVRGVKAYDPRTLTTAWTQNPALLARWFLVDSPYSPATQGGEIDDAELIASANVCDEVIDFSASDSGPRYTCNGALSCEDLPIDNLNTILDAMDGDSVWIGGKWQLIAGYYKEPTLTLDEGALSEADIVVTPQPARRDLFNTATGTYIGPGTGYQRSSFTPVSNAVYVAQDGGEQLTAEFNFALVNDPVRCQMIAWQRLQRARQALTVQLGTNLKGYDTAPLQTVALDLAEFGWANKPFAVRRRELDAPRLSYVLQETGPAVWAWNYLTADQPVDIPNTVLPDPFGVDTLVITALDSGDAQLILGQDGTIVSRIKASFAATTDNNVASGGRVEFQYQNVTVGDWLVAPSAEGSATAVWLSPVTDRSVYNVRGRFVNNAGRAGAWSAPKPHQVVGKTAKPPPVDSFSFMEQPGGVKQFFWTLAAPPLDLMSFDVRYSLGTTILPPSGMASLFAKDRDARRHETTEPVGDGVYTFCIRTVDTSNNVSPPVYITEVLDGDIFGAVTLIVLPHQDGWPGTLTDCIRENDYLTGLGNTSWDDLDVAWDDTEVTWDNTGGPPISYQHTLIDLGAIGSHAIRTAALAQGAVTTDYQSSTDNITYTAWLPVPGAPITFRYLRLRWGVAGPDPELYRAQAVIY